jgi:hypothetical protein
LAGVGRFVGRFSAFVGRFVGRFRNVDMCNLLICKHLQTLELGRFVGRFSAFVGRFVGRIGKVGEYIPKKTPAILTDGRGKEHKNKQ